jgi:exodeoxyribonuclease V gamma subunit
MDNCFKVFYSNRLEILAEKLKQDLFHNSTPFAKRFIFVPSPFMKSWLLWQIANDPQLGVACGMEIYTLHQGIPKLAVLLEDSVGHLFQNLSPLDLSLILEIEIRSIIDTFITLNIEEKKIWEPLLKYLQVQESYLSKKSEKRLVNLCSSLSELFYQYGIHGSKIVKQWEKGKADDWQKHLWNKVFANERTSNLSSLMEKWQKTKLSSKKAQIQVHLFGLSFLSEQHLNFFNHANSAAPLFYYLLSPSQEFWTDLLSDKSTHKIQKKFKNSQVPEDFDAYFCERNSLLANLGKLGSSLVRKLDHLSPETSSIYSLPRIIGEFPQYAHAPNENLFWNQESKTLTLLQALQADLITMRDPVKSDSIVLDKDDMSIQLHQAPSKIREIEILYDTILKLIDNHNNNKEPLYPSDILIMAPDIMSYESYIRAIFGSKESQLDFRLFDLRVQAQSSIVQAFLHLIQLSSSRWDADSVLQFFEYREVQRKFGLSLAEIREWKNWVHEASILWGDTSEHRNQLLQTAYYDKKMVDNDPMGTWEHGFKRLLLGLTMVLPKEELLQGKEIFDLETTPLQSMDGTRNQQLGKWIQLIRSLRRDLKPIVNNEKKTLSDWSAFLSSLCENYLSPDYEDKSSIEEYDHFKTQLSVTLRDETYSQQLFSWISVESHLNAKINQQNISYREHHAQAVRFCSLLPMRAIPARAIFLIGMDEEAFPKKTNRNPLNLLINNPLADYCPTPTDYDRYLFLETILSAREYLVFSYSKRNSGPELPSLLIQELLSYLDQGYTLEGEKVSQMITTEHPFYSFDQRYFDSKEKNLRSYSSFYFEGANALREKKITTHRFIEEFFLQIPRYYTKKESQEVVIDLKELHNVARNPIKNYFNKTLGIYLLSEESGKKTEEFSLHPLEAYQIKKTSLEAPLENVLIMAEKQGKLPKGLFKEVAIKQIIEDANQWKSLLQNLNISIDDLFSLEFGLNYEKCEQVEKKLWVYPAIEVSNKKIIGHLENLSPHGLVCYGDGSLQDIYKIWPQYLMICYLRESGFPIESKILWVKTGKITTRDVSTPLKYLEEYLNYYFYSLQTLSPMIPEWIEDIMTLDFDSFKKKVIQSYSRSWPPIHNGYLLWTLTKQQISEMTPQAFESWKEMVSAFFPLVDVNGRQWTATDNSGLK